VRTYVRVPPISNPDAAGDVPMPEYIKAAQMLSSAKMIRKAPLFKMMPPALLWLAMRNSFGWRPLMEGGWRSRDPGIFIGSGANTDYW
jgi:hypothetical protein